LSVIGRYARAARHGGFAPHSIFCEYVPLLSSRRGVYGQDRAQQTRKLGDCNAADDSTRHRSAMASGACKCGSARTANERSGREALSGSSVQGLENRRETRRWSINRRVVLAQYPCSQARLLRLSGLPVSWCTRPWGARSAPGERCLFRLDATASLRRAASFCAHE